MSNMAEATLNYSTVQSWTDLQYLSENMTETILTDIVESSTFYLKRFIFTACFVGLIILANIISLLAFLIEKRLRTYNNYFIINLSILDLLVGVALCISVVHIYLGRYPFSQNVCKVLSGIMYGIVNASNISVVVICADRYQAVYDPINHYISRTKRKAVIINCLPWVIGMSFWIGYITVWEFIIGFDNGDHCIHQYSVNPLTNIIQTGPMFFFPVLIIAILYFRISIKIRKSFGGKNINMKFDSTCAELSSTLNTSMTREGASWTPHSVTAVDTIEKGQGGVSVVPSMSDEATIKTSGQALPIQERVESTADTKKATRTLFLIVVAFVTTWISGSTISLIYSIAPRLILPGLSVEAYISFSLLVYGNSLLNPISYALSQPLFRATVIRMFSCKRT